MKQALFFFFLSLSLISEAQKTHASKNRKEAKIEQIISFHSDIVIDTTGLVRITEHIKVYATGDQIKRGLLRSIPLYRKDVNGIEKKVDFHITAITKNGQQEPYHIEDKDENRDIYIGNRNTFLPTGVYDYAISYTTKGQVGFFEGYDELYWNITGNDWKFLIRQASATVTLPPGAIIKNKACYTGVMGATLAECTPSVSSNGHTINFATTQALQVGEGLTIAVSWPAGIIQRPIPRKPIVLTATQRLVLAFLSFAALFLFYYRTWKKSGKDPAKPVVIPEFTIPYKLSPAAIRFLYKRHIDNTCFSVALINMAVKGRIKIINSKDRYEILKGAGGMQSLSEEEMGIYRALFKEKTHLPVIDKYHQEFTTAKNNFEGFLEQGFKMKDYFLSNTKQIVLSSLLTIITVIVYLILAEDLVKTITLFIILPFFTLGILLLVYAFKSIKKKLKLFRSIIIVFPGLVVSLISLLVVAVFLVKFAVVSIIWLIATFVSYTIYLSTIKAPTLQGAAVMAKIQGFKMYLETAEEHRLNLLNPPDVTPELFENFLPYAIALDVENEWGEKFDAVLTNYVPGWYQGEETNYKDLSRAFVRSFNSSLSDAQVDPTPAVISSGSNGSYSWSSGSSGRGSSGSGGGGGGGGGW